MSNAKKQRSSNKQLRIKLRLERTLERKMRRFFAKSNKQFLQNVDYDAEEDREELVGILEEHYNKTANKFVPFIFAEIDNALKDEEVRALSTIEKAAIIGTLISFITRNVLNSADAITSTTNRYMDDAIRTNGDDINAAYRQLQHKNIVRSSTIAATETQKASEGTKQITSEESQKVVQKTTLGLVFLRPKKEWMTRHDKRVRSAHNAADGQIRELDEPYVVGNELLMYPGDMSLGASLKNVANCRCNSVQSFDVVR